MAVQKNSPNRRKSIAFAQSSNPDRPRKPRRAHSVAPTDISPLTRSRLSLGPVKGILKSGAGLLSALRRSNTDPTPEASTSNRSSTSAASTPQQDNDATASMEFTQDYQAKIHDNFARKSMNRRVSFNEVLSVREFRPPEKNDTVSSVGSNANDQNSDDPPTSDPAPSPDAAPPVSNENDYPGAAHRTGRRSSVRQSLASDMDLTQVYQGDSSSLSQPFSDDEDDDMSMDGMDVTQVIGGVMHRRSSVRPALAQVPATELAEEPSFEEGNSGMSVDSVANEENQSQVDYEAKLAHKLRPADTDPQWVALRDLANGGREDASIEEESLRLDTSGSSVNEESILGGEADETVNLTKLMARRSSVGLMDVTGLYGGLLPDSHSTPRPSLAAPSSSPQLPTDGEEEEEAADAEAARIAERLQAASTAGPSKHQQVFSRPSSGPPQKRASWAAPTPVSAPSPARPRQTFTAAFAPPVSRPSPKRPTTPSAEADNNPKKRPRTSSFNSENVEPDSNPGNADTNPSSTTKSVAQSADPSTPKALSSAKKAPFQVQTNNAEASGSQKTTLRRPSGYLANRRSMGGPSAATSVNSNLQKKAAVLGKGRASVGPGLHASQNRRESDSRVVSFDKDLPTFAKPQQVNAPANEMAVDDEELDDAQSIVAPPLPIVEILPPTPVEAEGDMSLDAPQMQEQELDDHPLQEDVMIEDEGALGPEGESEEDMPQISIEEFLEMTGIRFMDELTVPRRSIYANDQRGAPRPVEEIPMAETAIAIGIDAPQLVLYSRVCQDLEAWMEKSKSEFRQAEQEAAKVTPELFEEYMKVDEESQEELKGHLKLIRKNSRGLARSDWYNWKLQWIEGLIVTANKAFAELEADARALESFLSDADDPIPALEQEYQEVLAELEREQAEVAASEACDQDYLAELKASISEQNIEVEALRTEVNEGKEQISWLKQRLQENHKEAHTIRGAIADSERVLHIRQQDTSALYKLTDELESLQDLYRFKALRVSPEVFEYVLASQYQVTIPCYDFIPQTENIKILHLPAVKTKYKDDFPRLTSFLVESMQSQIRRSGVTTVKQIAQSLGAYHSSFSQIRTQLRHITVRYPVQVDTSASTPDKRAFTLNATLMFPSVKGKALVSLTFDEAAFLNWPNAIGALKWNTNVAYGAIDPEALYNALDQRMAQVSPQDNFGCLLDACIEAQEAI